MYKTAKALQHLNFGSVRENAAYTQAEMDQT